LAVTYAMQSSCINPKEYLSSTKESLSNRLPAWLVASKEDKSKKGIQYSSGSIEIMRQKWCGSGCRFGEYFQAVSPEVDPVLKDVQDRLVPLTAIVRNMSKNDSAKTGKTKDE